MEDEKVAEVRQQLFDVANSIMSARNLMGFLALKSVSIEAVRNKIKEANIKLMKLRFGLMAVRDVLSDEEGLTDLELVLGLLMVVIVGFAVIICALACLAVPEL